jgi:hypothetical protein
MVVHYDCTFRLEENDIFSILPELFKMNRTVNIHVITLCPRQNIS